MIINGPRFRHYSDPRYTAVQLSCSRYIVDFSMELIYFSIAEILLYHRTLRFHSDQIYMNV